MTMLSDMYVPSDCIFYADAINSSKEMIEFFNHMLMDWILATKNNVSNSVAEVAIKNYLNKHKDTYEYFHCEKVEKKLLVSTCADITLYQYQSLNFVSKLF